MQPPYIYLKKRYAVNNILPEILSSLAMEILSPHEFIGEVSDIQEIQ